MTDTAAMDRFMGRIIQKPPRAVVLDKTDRKIITILADDSRISLSSVAKQVSLSRDAVNYRIQKMQNAGAILRFYPVIDLGRFGFKMFHTLLSIHEVVEERKMQLIERIVQHPNMMSVMEYSDRWDIELTIAAQSIDEYLAICMDLFDKNKKIIETAHVQVLDEFKSLAIPRSFYERIFIKHNGKKTPDPSFIPDAKDILILEGLNKDCRQSTYDLSRKVGLSPDAIGYRMKKLYSEDIIKKYVFLPNLSLMGYDGNIFAVKLRDFDSEKMASSIQFIKKHPAIIRAAYCFGRWDLYISITTRSADEFNHILKQLKNRFRDSLSEYEIFKTFREHKYDKFPEAVAKTHLHYLKTGEKLLCCKQTRKVSVGNNDTRQGIIA